VRDLDVDLLFLHAEQIDLRDIRHAQQVLAHLLDVVLEFPVAEAVGREREHHAVHVAELVVEERALQAGGQLTADVADLLADLVPDVADFPRRRRVLQQHEHQRLAGLAVGPDLVEVRRLLQLLLDLVGDLFGHLLRSGPRPVGADHHGAERERRVLVLAERGEGKRAADQQHHHQVAQQGLVFQRPRRQVEAARARHVNSASAILLDRGGAGRRRDRRRLGEQPDLLAFLELMGAGRHDDVARPRPSATTISLPATLPTEMRVRCTVLVDGSKRQACVAPPSTSSACSGTVMIGCASGTAKATVAVMPSATDAGCVDERNAAGKVRVAASATGETSRNLPRIGSPPPHRRTVISLAFFRIASCCSGMPTSTSFSSARASRRTDWPGRHHLADFGVDRGDHRIVRRAQHGIGGLVAGRARIRHRLLITGLGRVQARLAPVEFGPADEPFRFEILEAPVIGALLVAVDLCRCAGRLRRLGRKAVVLRVDRRQRLTLPDGLPHFHKPLGHPAADLETGARLDAGPYLARELGRRGGRARAQRDRANRSDVLGVGRRFRTRRQRERRAPVRENEESWAGARHDSEPLITDRSVI
jgi:hypothetical protein